GGSPPSPAPPSRSPRSASTWSATGSATSSTPSSGCRSPLTQAPGVAPVPGDIAIRPARPGEAAAVIDLWRRAEAIPSLTDTPEGLARLFRTPSAVLLVAVDGDSIVGSVIAGWDGWRGNLYRLAV